MKHAVLGFIFLLALMGCQRVYYGTMEQFGVEKRDILVDRVEDARDSQVEGQEKFRDALEQFRAVVDFKGEELEAQYDKLSDEYEDSQNAAGKIHNRVDAVENVASDLFKEWEDELEEYDNERLRRDSARKLRQTEQRYQQLISAMRDAESRLDPVLATMQDQVLYLKHNLNARAIQSLRGEVDAINRDVDELLVAMQSAIREADAFIREMRSEQT